MTAFLYDPALTNGEKSAIAADGVLVIAENEECRRCVGEDNTMFYMPHCDRPMYENVLWANWQTRFLTRFVIFGNSFRLIGERVPSSKLKEETPLLAKIVSGNRYKEASFIVDRFLDDDVFNDCALTWFPLAQLEIGEPDKADFWLKPETANRCTPLELASA